MGPGRLLPVVLVLLFLLPAMEAGARERAGNVDAFIVLDESGSMNRKVGDATLFRKVLDYVAGALVRDYLQPQDYLCVIGFSDVPHVRVSQQITSIQEKENIAQIVTNLNVVPSGYTDMGRVLEETRRQLGALANPSHQQILLILTDGLNQPPRESPYYMPVRPDTRKGLAPPSGFNEKFLAQVSQLSSEGWRIHVVGIGAETDAKNLAEALHAGYTILQEFNISELQTGLGNFWDDTINLEGLDLSGRSFLPASEIALKVKLHSASDKDREVELGGARISRLVSSTSGPLSQAVPVRLAVNRWSIPARKSATFELGARLPNDFPPGDFSATVTFDQESAVKFYPQEASFSFHVPGFWELHRNHVVLSSVAFAAALISLVLYRRRAISVGLVLEGETGGNPGKPFRFKVARFCSVGGGATDRFRVPGLPAKVAVLERRTVKRFALVSSMPDVLPTIMEYTLGDPVEFHAGAGNVRQLRFVRWKGKTPAPSARPSRPVQPPAVTPGADKMSGGVDFR